MASPPVSRGRLTLNVAEASGRTNEDQVVWDQSFVEGFVKVEVRGEGKTMKVASRPRRIISHSINWNEDLGLDVLEGAKELRLMLCREKRSETRTSTSVVAACGIFIEDIINAVPIDKYFELFKPGAAGPGGFIRISMNFDPTNTTPYHSPEGFKSAHSAVSDTSYQDLHMGDGQIERLTPRDSGVEAVTLQVFGQETGLQEMHASILLAALFAVRMFASDVCAQIKAHSFQKSKDQGSTLCQARAVLLKEVNGNDAGSAARRITEEAFESSTGAEANGEAPAFANATEAGETASSAPADAAPEVDLEPATETHAGPSKHGFRWLLFAGLIAAGAVAFSELSERQKSAKK